jgi:hypothetical protein
LLIGIPFTGEIRAYSSVAELTQHLSSSAVAPLAYASMWSLHQYSIILKCGVSASLEQETCQIFRDVAMRQDHQMRMPVVLEVGVSHLRITSVNLVL